MNQETAQPLPAQQDGLNPEQIQTAVMLRQDTQGAHAHYFKMKHAHRDYMKDRRRARSRGHYPHPLDVAGIVGLDIVTSAAIQPVVSAVGKHAFKKAQLAAGEHYENHEAAYQEQAVNEATEAGVELNGWPQK